MAGDHPRGHDGSVEGEAADHGRVGRVGDVHEGDLGEAPSWGDDVGLGADEGPDVPTGADYDEAVTVEETRRRRSPSRG